MGRRTDLAARITQPSAQLIEFTGVTRLARKLLGTFQVRHCLCACAEPEHLNHG